MRCIRCLCVCVCVCVCIRVYRVLRGNATTHFSTSAATPDCTGQRAREEYGRRGDQTADFTVHRPHHLPDDDDDTAADLDTPATTAVAVKINKTRNKLQIDFFSLSIFAFYILQTRPASVHMAQRWTRAKRGNRGSSFDPFN